MTTYRTCAHCGGYRESRLMATAECCVFCQENGALAPPAEQVASSEDVEFIRGYYQTLLGGAP